MGRKKRPFYRIVAADIRSPRDGKFIEELGWYDPCSKEEQNFKYNEELVKKWLDDGAQPTETVKGIFVRGGTVERDPVDPKTLRKPKVRKHSDKLRKHQAKEEAAEENAEA